MPKNEADFLPYLQVLRAVASLSVMTVHTQWATPFAGVGVDMFFVLSGFIMMQLYANSSSTSINLWHYSLKRLIRIYPTYWLIISTYLIFYFFLGSLSSVYHQDMAGYAKSFLLMPYHPPIVYPSWTLSHELLFYAFYALWLSSKAGKFILIIWQILCWVHLFCYIFHISFSISGFIFHASNTEFGLGMLAHYIISNKFFHNYLKNYMWFIIIIISVLSLGVLTTLWKEGVRSLYAGILSAVIIASLHLLNKRVALHTPVFLVKLGDASYILYLVHVIFLALFSYLTPSFGEIFGMCAAIIFSLWAHKWIEKPLLNRLKQRLL